MSTSTLKKKGRVLVTAALPYANGDIHLGHLVEYLQADFWVRFLKMYDNQEVIYLCADDTHGTPIMLKAREKGISPEELIDWFKKRHCKDFSDFEIDFDHYSSTNSALNRELCEKFYIEMKNNDLLETKNISQAYSEKDKMFLPDRFVIGVCPQCSAEDQYGDSCEECSSTHTPLELKNARSRISGDTIVAKKSEHIFFKLEPFREFLKKWVCQHTQTEVYNKLKEWFDKPLKNWDISRDAPYFGFPIPGESGKYFYVWVDAPLGYISATKEWCAQQSGTYLDYWSENCSSKIYHFIGKDIIYFHALFWPAMLKNAQLKTPTKIFVHGFLTVNGEKMSKSKGTFINARTYLENFDPSYLRYYFASKLSSKIEDIDLNLEHFVSSVNSELIGKITNLGSRSMKMLERHFENNLGDLNSAGLSLLKKTQDQKKEILDHYHNRDFAKVIEAVRNICDNANRFFDQEAPWKTINIHREEAHEVISTVINIFRIIVIFLTPILPNYSSQVRSFFGEDHYTWDSLSSLQTGKIHSYSHLLQKLSMDAVKKLIHASQ